jgi:hypothetical protein
VWLFRTEWQWLVSDSTFSVTLTHSHSPHSHSVSAHTRIPHPPPPTHTTHTPHAVTHIWKLCACTDEYSDSELASIVCDLVTGESTGHDVDVSKYELEMRTVVGGNVITAPLHLPPGARADVYYKVHSPTFFCRVYIASIAIHGCYEIGYQRCYFNLSTNTVPLHAENVCGPIVRYNPQPILAQIQTFHFGGKIACSVVVPRCQAAVSFCAKSLGPAIVCASVA